MKLYIAAPWVDRAYASAVATEFERAGHTITHKWWDVDSTHEPPTMSSLHDAYSHEFLCDQALEDIRGVLACEVFILLDTRKSEGKAVEQGIALITGKPILAIGICGSESLNVFHHLPCYTWVPTIDMATTKVVTLIESPSMPT